MFSLDPPSSERELPTNEEIFIMYMMMYITRSTVSSYSKSVFRPTRFSSRKLKEKYNCKNQGLVLGLSISPITIKLYNLKYLFLLLIIAVRGSIIYVFYSPYKINNTFVSNIQYTRHRTVTTVTQMFKLSYNRFGIWDNSPSCYKSL